jgi:hypothetical protein
VEETIHVLSGRFKIRIGGETFRCAEGGFAYPAVGRPARVPQPDGRAGRDRRRLYAGGGHKFYEELGPLTRNGSPDRATVAAVFEKQGMTLLGPPLTLD